MCTYDLKIKAINSICYFSSEWFSFPYSGNGSVSPIVFALGSCLCKDCNTLSCSTKGVNKAELAKTVTFEHQVLSRCKLRVTWLCYLYLLPFLGKHASQSSFVVLIKFLKRKYQKDLVSCPFNVVLFSFLALYLSISLLLPDPYFPGLPLKILCSFRQNE